MGLDFIEQGVSADPHDGSLSIILTELERIDFLIQLQVWRARNLNLLDENFQGLYIAEEEIDALLGEPAGLPRWAGVPLPLSDEDVCGCPATHRCRHRPPEPRVGCARGAGAPGSTLRGL